MIARSRRVANDRYLRIGLKMDFLDRLLRHDAWTTKAILEICATLSDEQLDREFDIGHRTVRATLHHIIDNMEVWSSLMQEAKIERATDKTIPGMLRRLDHAQSQLDSVARTIADKNAWDDVWTDYLDDPPRQKRFGTALAHVVTHSMHHRAQLLYMLRLSGLDSLPEGDVFSWESANE